MTIAATASRGLLFALTAVLCTGACARAATVTEFSAGISPDSGPRSITTGPDGNLWFTEADGDRIGRITPAGVVTEFSEGITPGSVPLGITSGPDGNVWFTEYDAGRIGRITPAGVVTEFSEGITPGSSPSAIVTGTDGNLWYTDGNGRRIGRITPAGVVTEFSVNSGAGGGPQAITAGPDGNIWFNEFIGGVGRMTPMGGFTRFLDAYRYGLGIAAGADGNLWTTEYSGPIRRMTPAGVVTGEFALPPDMSAEGIAAGADGNLWFTTLGYDSIGRITPSGEIVLVSTGVSPGSGPRSITAGPDGNLWFTEPGLDQIGRITPSIEAPVVAVADPTAVAATAATLNGTVDARSLDTTVTFEYGPTPAYGAKTAAQSFADRSAQPVSAVLTNLQPATTYHYRLVATSGGGSAQSSDRTFTTAAAFVAPPPPPLTPPPPPASMPPAACSNGRDDDRDGFVDAADPRCHIDGDRRNADSYQPQGASESPVEDPTLVCSSGGLALISVEPTSLRRRVRLRGVADPSRAGQPVELYAGAQRLGTARVQPDGSFTATPSASRRAATRVRYQARLGTRRSQSVAAQRRFAGLRLAATNGSVVFSGRTVGRRPRSVELLGRAGGCGTFKRLATVRVRRGGRFAPSAAAFGDVDIAPYRLRIASAGSAGPRESTPPRSIALR